MTAPVRVGLGFDSHAFATAPGRALVLGGVTVPGPGLAGHSDADVIAHAVADGLLGASGLGDLGSHFPDDDPAWEGADSIELLGRVAAMLHRDGWTVGNVDCAVIADVPPRLAPHRAAMENRLSTAVAGLVTVKPKHAEGLGALGREGIACYAVALVTRA